MWVGAVQRWGGCSLAQGGGRTEAGGFQNRTRLSPASDHCHARPATPDLVDCRWLLLSQGECEEDDNSPPVISLFGVNAFARALVDAGATVEYSYISDPTSSPRLLAFLRLQMTTASTMMARESKDPTIPTINVRFDWDLDCSPVLGSDDWEGV